MTKNDDLLFIYLATNDVEDTKILANEEQAITDEKTETIQSNATRIVRKTGSQKKRRRMTHRLHISNTHINILATL